MSKVEIGVEQYEPDWKYIDSHYKLTLTNVQVPHKTEPFSLPEGGHRYCVVCYTRQDFFTLREGDAARILLRARQYPCWTSSYIMYTYIGHTTWTYRYPKMPLPVIDVTEKWVSRARFLIQKHIEDADLSELLMDMEDII